jgi:hypothetical protein
MKTCLNNCGWASGEHASGEGHGVCDPDGLEPYLISTCGEGGESLNRVARDLDAGCRMFGKRSDRHAYVLVRRLPDPAFAGAVVYNNR